MGSTDLQRWDWYRNVMLWVFFLLPESTSFVLRRLYDHSDFSETPCEKPFFQKSLAKSAKRTDEHNVLKTSPLSLRIHEEFTDDP